MSVSTLADLVGICVGFCCLRSQLELLLLFICLYNLTIYLRYKEEGEVIELHWKLKLTNTICTLVSTNTFLALDHGVLSSTWCRLGIKVLLLKW